VSAFQLTPNQESGTNGVYHRPFGSRRLAISIKMLNGIAHQHIGIEPEATALGLFEKIQIV
jgi:hypothetical protein